MSVAEGLGSAELVGAGGLGIGSGPSFAEKLVVVRERREKAAQRGCHHVGVIYLSRQRSFLGSLALLVAAVAAVAR